MHLEKGKARKASERGLGSFTTNLWGQIALEGDGGGKREEARKRTEKNASPQTKRANWGQATGNIRTVMWIVISTNCE